MDDNKIEPPNSRYEQCQSKVVEAHIKDACRLCKSYYTLIPINFPIINVMPPAKQPIANILSPRNMGLRLLNKLRIVPMIKSASAVPAILMEAFQLHGCMRKGTSGISAPIMKDKQEASIAPIGETSSSGLMPSSSRANVFKAVSGLLIISVASLSASNAGMPLA